MKKITMNKSQGDFIFMYKYIITKIIYKKGRNIYDKHCTNK